MQQAATIAAEARDIALDFEMFDEPRERIEYLLDLGKSLPPLDERHKTDANLVRGCQSRVWLVGDYDPRTGLMRIEADSDAFIVKGLISLLLRLYDNRRPEDILNNPPDVFEQIGLGKMLTPGRANGLYSMINRIRQLAGAYASAA